MIDFFGRTTDSRQRGEGFEYEPHVMQLTTQGVMDDVAAAVGYIRTTEGGAPDGSTRPASALVGASASSRPAPAMT